MASVASSLSAPCFGNGTRRFAARMSGQAASNKQRVLFVCLGNICRSPSAEAVFRSVVEREGVADQFDIDSCGTGGGSSDWCAAASEAAATAAAARQLARPLAHQ